MSGGHFDRLRIFLLAFFRAAVAPLVEAAVFRKIRRVDDLSLDRLQTVHVRFQIRNGVEQADRVGVLRTVENVFGRAGFHDLARPLLRRAADFADADEAAKTKALLDLADSSRLLLDDAEAAKIFRELVDGPKTAPDVRAKAYAGLMRTMLAPAEYEWRPTPEALDRAQALYDAAFAERRLTPKDKAGLIEIMKTPFIRGGRAEKLISLCEEWIKPGAAFHKEGLAAMLYEAQGDAYASLRQYAKAVSRYSRTPVNYYNKHRLLEKTGENARKAKDFRKAQQAYSDLIALVDKEEDKSTYNRLSRIIVSLTKATQNATKAEAATVIETGEFSDLSLDE